MHRSRREFARKINLNVFVAVADRIVNRAKERPTLRGEPRFFFQFAACRRKSLFPRINFSGRNFPEGTARRCAPLPLQHDALMFVKRYYRSRPAVPGHFPRRELAVGKPYFQATHVHQPSVKDRRFRDNFFF